MRPASRSASPVARGRGARRTSGRAPPRARPRPELEEDVRDGVRRLVRVAEIRRAEHGGDDEDPHEADQSRRRRRDPHPGSGAGDPRIAHLAHRCHHSGQLPFGTLPEPVVADDPPRQIREREHGGHGALGALEVVDGRHPLGEGLVRAEPFERVAPAPSPPCRRGNASAATRGTPRRARRGRRARSPGAAGTAAPVPVTSSARVLGPPMRSSAGGSEPTPATLTNPASTSGTQRIRAARRRALREPRRERLPAVVAQRRPPSRRREPERLGQRLHVVAARAATTDPRATPRPARCRRRVGRA